MERPKPKETPCFGITVVDEGTCYTTHINTKGTPIQVMQMMLHFLEHLEETLTTLKNCK